MNKTQIMIRLGIFIGLGIAFMFGRWSVPETVCPECVPEDPKTITIIKTKVDTVPEVFDCLQLPENAECTVGHFYR